MLKQPTFSSPSKRLYRVLTGASMPPTLSDGVTDSQRPSTYSSALTEAWNSSNTASCNRHQSEGSQTQQTRTTCLFCSNLVLLMGNGNNEDTKKRSRMIKNLCVHMQISSKDIPNQCSSTMFPLCKLCDALVSQLWEFQGMLDKIKLKVSEVVGKIERTVVDGEILSPKLSKSSVSTLEEQKFTQLRNLILDGYRNKLIMKQQIQNNLVLSNPISSLRLNSINIKTECLSEQENLGEIGDRFSVSSSLDLDPPSVDRSEFDMIIDDVSANQEIIQVPETTSPETPSPPPVPRQTSPDVSPTFEHHRASISSDEGSLHIDETGCEQEDSEWTVNPEVIAQYNDSSSTLVISNIHGSRERETEAAAPSLIAIKREISNGENLIELNVDEDDDAMGQSDSDNDEIFMLEPRKRRMLFGNVEIFKCYGSLKHGGECLQCGLCDHKIRIPKKSSRGDVTPITKMKLHIQAVHRPTAVVPIGNTSAPKRLHTCLICSKTFTRREYLVEHRKRHSAEEAVECDICGRPIKNTSRFNLLLHKFSHKNDEERREAIASGETGTPRSLLSTKRKIKKKKPARKELTKTKKGQQEKDVEKPFGCNVCQRAFTKQCYLTLHARVHVNICVQNQLANTMPRLVGEQRAEHVHNEGVQLPLLLAQEETAEVPPNTNPSGERSILLEPVEMEQQQEPSWMGHTEQLLNSTGANGTRNPDELAITLPILKREVLD
ncbi:unnamed protein product [Orchesella dallaii]|uniref:C2H2-type domain-containing protein n=1 Tax=Orchesella dallaii TaxID=48710 RepID=A0ABP1PSW5_9HEXA